MIFMGTTFCGGVNSLSITPSNASNINDITLKNGVIDDLHITRDTSYAFTTTPPDWDYDTILHALFNGNLHAGNVDFSIEQCSAIRIKRRKKGEFQWMTLFEIPIEKVEDFNFERFDYLVRANVEYEYGFFAILNDIEGSPDINSIECKFDGVFIVGRDKIFNTLLDIEHSEKRNRPVGVINTIDKKYPITVSNGNNNYYSGNVKGTFVELDKTTCEFNFEDSWKYREKLDEFLYDGESKILKFDRGQMWLVNIVDRQPDTNNGHPDFVTSEFSWVEVGDCENFEDLYDAGLLDYEGWRLNV